MKSNSTTGENTILIIEDDLDFAESLKLKTEESSLPVEVTIIKDFRMGLEHLKSISPAVVVLDIFEGKPQYDKKEGLPVWDEIWNNSFSPLIFASAARLEEFVHIADKHPLIKYVVKTEAGAMDHLLQGIKCFLPFGGGINRIKKSLLKDCAIATQKALTETVPHIWAGKIEGKEKISLIENTTRRRLASLLRIKAEEEREKVFAWEQYIYPAVAPHLLMGDILISAKGRSDNPSAFRVVLTPSCDLVPGQKETVENVLVAKCVPIRSYCEKCSLPKLKDGKIKEEGKKRWRSSLSQAQMAGLHPLPQYSDLIPHMAISLRELEILQIIDSEKARSGDTEFTRIASIDSPFREHLAWAYLQIAGRPGMPNRDMDSWIEAILENLSTITTEEITTEE